MSEYFTSLTSNVFCVKNLPEVVKGALFSKYSRSYLGLRELLKKEFSETIEGKSEDFYDRILDGFGDDSISELGGAHLAVEEISMLAAKVIEDCRIGGSPIEKSTRYIYFDRRNKDNEWKYYRDPKILASKHSQGYIQTCDKLFETYSSMVKRLKPLVESKIPQGDTPTGAYQASVRAKTLDLLRGLLPTSALTNMGIFGNGRFFSGLLSKLDCSELAELQELNRGAFMELDKVIPAFIRRSETSHKNQKSLRKYLASIKSAKKANVTITRDLPKNSSVSLVGFDPCVNLSVATTLCFEESNSCIEDIAEYFVNFTTEDYSKFFREFTYSRENRRHKSPRALENADFMFEIVGDFGMYRDLQRHRTLTQERQRLTCDLGYFIPEEIIGTEFEEEYRSAMNLAGDFHDSLVDDFPEESQYAVPMAYNIRWYFKVNLRALQWICEIRSSPQGHENYRKVAQKMAKEVCKIFPEFECFFDFVDYNEYQLGRLQQEKLANKS